MKNILEGTDNIYADLGFPDAQEMRVKAQLATTISDIITARKLTQQQAAEIVGMTQPKLSQLLNGHFRGISEAKMMDCLARLGRDVRIIIGQDRPRRRNPARIEVLQEAALASA